VGPDTVRVLIESGASVLAVEAGKTLLFEREEMMRLADGSGIAVMGIGPEWVSSQEAGKAMVGKEP
jgi:hypothetical protein